MTRIIGLARVARLFTSISKLIFWHLLSEACACLLPKSKLSEKKLIGDFDGTRLNIDLPTTQESLCSAVRFER
jgi:hypothetical protein